MEQHPVPQNVTTFQFRLIGDMTIKQFGYLVGGAILAYIMYKLPLPFFFTWPLAILSVLTGVGFAFVPIEERPMDVWVLSFIKSIYSPTQYVWSKNTPQPQTAVNTPVAAPAVTPVSAPVPSTPAQPVPPPPPAVNPMPEPVTRRDDILNNIFLPTASAPVSATGVLTMNAPKKGLFERIFELFAPKPKMRSGASLQARVPTSAGQWAPLPARSMDFSPPPIVRPAPNVQKDLEETEEKESVLEEKLKKLQAELEGKNAAQSRILELQTQLTELLAERDKMNHEMEQLRRQGNATMPATTRLPSLRSLAASPGLAGGLAGVSGQAQTPSGPTIQIIAPSRAVNVGLPRLTTFPNVVTGIVKDKEKNLLPGVLVTVKDKEGVPLRALKTNRLGQFAASTQLPNGVYFVETEDPRLRFTFDRAQITLNGTIVPALEIFAKSEKEITRAKLAKELFGNNSN